MVSALKVAGDNGSDAFRNLPYVGVSPPPDPNVNAGLSDVVTRSARLDPHWKVKDDPLNSRGVKQIDPQSQANVLWVDRARVFQTAVEQLTNDFGAVDLAINDLTPEGTLEWW